MTTSSTIKPEQKRLDPSIHTGVDQAFIGINLAAETENRAQFLRQVPKQRRKSYRPLDRGAKHRQLARKGILLGECRLKPAKRSNLKSFFQDVID